MVLERAFSFGGDVAETPTLESLFQTHATDVSRLVSRLLGPGASRADVEDLVQQIFLAVHRALPKFRGESKTSTWLFGIASRTVFKEIRNRTRQRRMVASLEAMISVGPTTGAPHDQKVIEHQELARVWRALMEIAPKKRIVFVLHEIEALSGREIAVALDIREGTVHTRLYHARRELMAKLEKEAR
jgi:RNA polymerase sigma-70 factor (ECF subfamily)